MLRLFRRGSREEETVVQDLRDIGCVLTHTGSDQLELKIGPHVVGYPDGVIESGLPEAPETRHLLEIKTHNTKSFAKLQKEGIPHRHMAQMQGCMGAAKIDRCLYVGVCKDDDSLHIERVYFDQEMAGKIKARADMIVSAPEAPLRIKDDPSWYECKFCPFASICYKEEAAEKNCRTCAHSTPVDDGWMCERWGKLIPDHIIEEGCQAYVPHPDMHPGEIIEADGWTATYEWKGREVKYGV
ncbi:MAG: hypothetical protein WC982_09645 [Advenella sp.]